MLSFQNRFHGYNALKTVYKDGKSIRTQTITLRYKDNPRRKQSRVAIVVGKKVIKSAVSRNRIRRRVYEQVRLKLDNIPKPQDLVFIITSPDILVTSSKELEKTVISCLTDAGLYKKS